MYVCAHMYAGRHHAPPPTQYMKQLQQKVGSKRLYLLAFAAEDAHTKEPWCPDCAQLEPTMESVLRENEEIAQSVVCVVAPLKREVYRRPDHPYRVHKDLQLYSIPTLYRYRVESGGFDEERIVFDGSNQRDDIVSYLQK
uniref:Thioredoxin domain-containing protein 17 n=1 Tax=Lygus hesperus TaxID=30085 RepID=A0A0A9ZDY0_LYGHE